MTSKIGIHAMDQHASQVEAAALLNSYQPSLFKNAFMGYGWTYDVYTRLNYQPTVIQRYWWSDGHLGTPDKFAALVQQTKYLNGGKWLPQNAADAWCKFVVVADRDPAQMHATIRERMYVEGYNEQGIDATYCEFERERVRILFDRYGLKSAVLSSGVGWEIPWQIAKDTGLLDELRRTGSLIAVHAYSGLFINLWHGAAKAATEDGKLAQAPIEYVKSRELLPPERLDTWLAFRVARYHDELSNLNFHDLKFVISEFGFDNVGDRTYKHYTGGYPGRGWVPGSPESWTPYWIKNGFISKAHEAAAFYASELWYADKQLDLYPFVVGAVPFSWGGAGDWAHFDTTAVMPLFAAIAQGGTPPAPIPEPSPEPEPIPTPEPTPEPIPTPGDEVFILDLDIRISEPMSIALHVTGTIRARQAVKAETLEKAVAVIASVQEMAGGERKAPPPPETEPEGIEKPS